MLSVTCQQMQDIEAASFKQGHKPESLMEQAGAGIAKTILHYFPNKRNAVAYLGRGHNAGDALVALRILRDLGWQVGIRCENALHELAPLTRRKLRELGDDFYYNQKRPEKDSIILDGLLGIGAKGPLREPLALLAGEMNHHRVQGRSNTIAMDIPSGINGDTGEVYDGAVIADLTITIAIPKTGLLSQNAVNHVGSLALVPLEALTPENIQPSQPRPLHLTTRHSIKRKRRSFDTHKGQAGRVGIWAGSEGMLGAASLCAEAAIRSGAGLVTLFTPPTLYAALASITPREIIITPSINPQDLLKSRFDALVIGPGLGSPVASLAEKLFAVIQETELPCVLDADMLNLIAREKRLDLFRKNTILTPHPGEMARIYPASEHFSRVPTADNFTSEYSSTLLYKGARTLVAWEASPIYHNSTGTPAMATAGQGDVLSGLIGGLCAQGYPNLEAARLAAWLCGEACQLALRESHITEETLTASDTIAHLAQAFDALT
ncbi:bifunctional NAD(P)H-hydrate repair enzyme Nnr [Rubritalea halochordaticola]|uniref:Bifunctional NAD(P)H-hydrate repair enzyme n=1 Tax=Rubritalea halochordaticola TaxID=714537 RepID=A0ABP9UYU4_9BACT